MVEDSRRAWFMSLRWQIWVSYHIILALSLSKWWRYLYLWKEVCSWDFEEVQDANIKASGYSSWDKHGVEQERPRCRGRSHIFQEFGRKSLLFDSEYIAASSCATLRLKRLPGEFGYFSEDSMKCFVTIVQQFPLQRIQFFMEDTRTLTFAITSFEIWAKSKRLSYYTSEVMIKLRYFHNY